MAELMGEEDDPSGMYYIYSTRQKRQYVLTHERGSLTATIIHGFVAPRNQSMYK
jgi:hypothetical protein